MYILGIFREDLASKIYVGFLEVTDKFSLCFPVFEHSSNDTLGRRNKIIMNSRFQIAVRNGNQASVSLIIFCTQSCVWAVVFQVFALPLVSLQRSPLPSCVPRPGSLVDKKAPERPGKPAMSFKSKAVRLTSFSSKGRLRHSNSDLGFQSVFVLLFQLSSSLPTPTPRASSPALWDLPSTCTLGLSVSTKLSQTSSCTPRRMPVRKLRYLQNANSSISTKCYFRKRQETWFSPSLPVMLAPARVPS